MLTRKAKIVGTSRLCKGEYFIHSHALVESNTIGAGTRIWAFAHVMSGAQIGRNCNICDNAYIEGGAIIGDNVTVKNGVSVWELVTIENDVFLGPNMVFTNDLNPRAAIKKSKDALVGTVVRDGASIGANATVVCGIEIGRYAFIGAGSVVTRDIPNYALVVGNPSRQIGWVCACARRLPLGLELTIGQTAACSICDRRYVVDVAGVTAQLPQPK